MKAILLDPKTGKLELAETPAPQISPYEVLIRNSYSLISPGTEKATLRLARKNYLQKAKERPDLVKKLLGLIAREGIFAAWNIAQARLAAPIPLGYSSSGEIIKVGSKVSGFKVGDKVAASGYKFASHAEYTAVPQNWFVKVPENCPMEQAAFASIGSIPLNSVHLSNVTQGERVAVIGLGLLGKITCAILRAYGHQVLGIDPAAAQRQKTKQWLGIQVCSPQEAPVLKEQLTGGIGYDAVIIMAAASSNEPLKLAAELVRLRGKVVATGNVGLNIPRRQFFEKEVEFTIPHSGGTGHLNPWHREFGLDYPLPFVRWTQGRNLAEFLRLIAQENLNLEPLINKKIPFEKALSAYEMLETSKTPLDGLILKYPTAVKKTPEAITLIHKEKPLRALPKDQIGIGIIGVGNFGQGTLLPALKKLKNARLIATSAKTGAAAVQAGKRFGAEYATTRPEKIIKDKNIDLVVIATRHDLHAPLAVKALEAGKSVHLEKPPALDKKELDRLLKAAQKSEGQLFVGYNRRFSKPIQKIKNFIGRDPKIIHLRYQAGPVPSDHWVYHPEQGGGRIIGEMGHFIDLASFLTDSLPVEVSAWQLPGGQHPSDQLLAIIKFRDGSLLEIEFLTSPRYRFPAEHLAVFSAQKSAFLNDFARQELHSPEGDRISLNLPDKGHAKMLEAEIKALKTGQSQLISLESLQATSLATFVIEEALREGRSLKLEAGS